MPTRPHRRVREGRLRLSRYPMSSSRARCNSSDRRLDVRRKKSEGRSWRKEDESTQMSSNFFVQTSEFSHQVASPPRAQRPSRRPTPSAPNDPALHVSPNAMSVVLPHVFTHVDELCRRGERAARGLDEGGDPQHDILAYLQKCRHV